MAETGNHKDDLHEEFGKMYLPRFTRVFNDEEKEIVMSTKDLDTKQFTDYLDRIQQFAASFHGIILPQPEDKVFGEFYSQYKRFI